MLSKIYSTLKSDAARPLRFILVGCIATLVHITMASLILFIWPETSAFITNIISFFIAFIVSFYGHRYMTFSTRGSIFRFFVVAISGFIVNNIILASALTLGLPKIISIVVATACVPVITYLASSLWAFKN